MGGTGCRIFYEWRTTRNNHGGCPKLGHNGGTLPPQDPAICCPRILLVIHQRSDPMVLSLDLAYLVLVDTTVNVVWGYATKVAKGRREGFEMCCLGSLGLVLSHVD